MHLTSATQTIRLTLLGPTGLTGADGTSLSSVLAHPKRLALLAYLALSGAGRFHRRDTLVGLLWPELPDENARASLRKAIYHLRRSLGEHAIVSRGDDDVALSDDVICDVTELEEALAASDPARAYELYAGPLLPGFYVADAPAFEKWLERERARLHHHAFTAAWRMAEREEDRGERYAAAHWARQALALVPDDEGALRRVLELLDRVGDRAGALAAYDDFARHLEADYEVEPSEETRALVRRISLDDRRETIDDRPASSVDRPDEPAIVAEIQPTPSRRGDDIAVDRLPSTRPYLHRSLASRLQQHRAVAAATLAILFLAAGTAVLRAPAGIQQNLIAVFPFTYSGGAELGYLQAGMPGLLVTGLDGAGELRALDPLLPDASDRDALSDPVAAAEAARSLGAGLFVLGDIVQVGSSVRISASLHETLDEDAVPVRASVSGPVENLFALVDELSATLLAERASQAGALVRVASRTTESLDALKAYLEGESHFRTGHYKEAVSAYQAAVAQDTTFALAYYRLAAAYSWSSDTLALPTAQIALRHADRLAPIDRLLVDAFIPYLEGRATEAERLYRSILSTYPSEPEAWQPLGEVLFHFNPTRGRPIGEARAPFEFALRIGPSDAPLTHLAEITAIEGDYAAFDSLMRRIEPGAHFDVVGRTVRAFTIGTEADRVGALTEVAALSDADLGNTARHMLYLVEDDAAAARVVRVLTEPTRSREVRALGHILLAHIDAGGGRPLAAARHLDHALQLDRVRALEHRALLHSLPFLPVSRPTIVATRDALARSPVTGGGRETGIVFSGDAGMHPYFRTYLLGLLAARLGEEDAAIALASETARFDATSDGPTLAMDLARGVRARVAYERGDFEEVLRALEHQEIERSGNDLMGFVPFHSQPQERFLLAESLRAEGRDEEALGWYGSYEEHAPYGRAFRAIADLRRSEIHASLGNYDEAARYLARFIDRWEDAEPALEPMVHDAREYLDRIRRRG